MRLVLAIAFIAYPLAVYLLPESVPRWALIGLFGALACGRVWLVNPLSAVQRGLGLAAIVAYCGLALMGPELTVLKIYPVLINAAGAGYGLYTLCYPPSAIERLARATGMAMDATGQHYTRKVTIVWVLFFVLNSLAAAYTALYCTTAVWSLYNGIVSYVLVALLFAIEYWYRGHYRRAHSAAS